MSENFFELFKHKIMYFSMQERKKREYLEFERAYIRLKNLTKIEFKAEYINTKSKYEYRKNMMTLFIITVLLSILFDVWSEFYIFLKQVMSFIFINQGNDIQIAKIGIILSIIIIGFITLVLFFTIIVFIKDTYNIYRHLLILEDIRDDIANP